MATISGLNTNGLNFGGLATGINTDSLIEGLTQINQRRIDQLKSQQLDLTTKQTAFATIKGALFDLQSKTSALSRAAGGAFDGRKVTSSDSSAVSAVAGTAASPGTYTLTVTALAQANQIASQGFADPNAQIKEGTLALQVGTGAAATITVDSRNNTLQGLADSINAATKDVRAAVINDGSGTPYRLTLTATKTGTANAITLTNNLTGGTGAAIDPALATLQAAGDAAVKVGSGPGALTVTSATNQVNGLIPGVSLNLLAADANKPITLTVAADTDAASKAVQDFVTSYNATIDFISSQSKFDAKTQQAGVLLGNRDASELVNDLASALNTTIPGLSSSANRLSSVGLSFGNDGKLVLDQTKLDRALSGQTGATPADLKRLFAMSGTSNNPGVAFVTGSNKTQPSAGAPYQVNVTAPATRATATATSALGGSVTLSPPNNALVLKLNGLTSTGITLDPGTYTPEALADLLQQRINANSALNGNLVSVGLSAGNKLQITSQAYGTASTVSFVSGGALASLGFTGTETATGTNVAGTIVVNGQTETATGSGQMLVGDDANAKTAGLQVRVTAGTATTADVTVTQGVAGRLSAVLGKYLDATGGKLKTIGDGFQKRTDDIDKLIARQNDLLESKKEDLIRQFAAMESAVNNLKGLQSQLSSLVPLNLNK